MAPTLGVNVGGAHVEDHRGRLDWPADVAAVVLGCQYRADRHPQIPREWSVDQELGPTNFFHSADALAIEAGHIHTNPDLPWPRPTCFEDLALLVVRLLRHIRSSLTSQPPMW